MYNLTVDGRMMKYIALLIFILCTTVFCMVEPNEYIDGKWYNCTSVTYNDAGDTIYYKFGWGGQHNYYYNSTGKRTQLKSLDANNTVRSTIYYIYDANGNLIKEYDKSPDKYTVKYKRDSLGRLIEMRIFFNNKIMEHAVYYYDSLGRQNYIEITEHTLDKCKYKIWKNYNQFNLSLTKEVRTCQNSNGHTIKEYSSDGIIKHEQTYAQYTKDCPVDELCYHEHEYWYDTHGNLVESIHVHYKNGDSESTHSTYYKVYDTNGRLIYEEDEIGVGTKYIYFDKGNTHYKCRDE